MFLSNIICPKMSKEFVLQRSIFLCLHEGWSCKANDGFWIHFITQGTFEVLMWHKMFIFALRLQAKHRSNNTILFWNFLRNNSLVRFLRSCSWFLITVLIQQKDTVIIAPLSVVEVFVHLCVYICVGSGAGGRKWIYPFS